MIKNLIKKLFKKKTPLQTKKPVVQLPHQTVPAPAVLSDDSWFSKPVKSEKVIAYEKHVAQKIEEQKFIEAAQPKKEAQDIHQQMYERASKYWGTWQENVGGSENFQSGPGGWNSGTGMRQFD